MSANLTTLLSILGQYLGPAPSIAPLYIGALSKLSKTGKNGKTSIGQASAYMNIIIIFTASFIFGLPKTIYALFALILQNAIVDFVVLGNSDSKLCIIKTKNIELIEEFLQKDFIVGYSVLPSLGGTDKKKRRTIMCVVTSREYYRFKNLILEIDPNAFFVTHDCYEVLGGYNERKIKLRLFEYN